jgi:hypothetical protein
VATQHEIDSLIIRMTGDGTEYAAMLEKQAAATTSQTRRMEASFKGMSMSIRDSMHGIHLLSMVGVAGPEGTHAIMQLVYAHHILGGSMKEVVKQAGLMKSVMVGGLAVGAIAAVSALAAAWHNLTRMENEAAGAAGEYYRQSLEEDPERVFRKKQRALILEGEQKRVEAEMKPAGLFSKERYRLELGSWQGFVKSLGDVFGSEQRVQQREGERTKDEYGFKLKALEEAHKRYMKSPERAQDATIAFRDKLEDTTTAIEKEARAIGRSAEEMKLYEMILTLAKSANISFAEAVAQNTAFINKYTDAVNRSKAAKITEENLLPTERYAKQLKELDKFKALLDPAVYQRARGKIAKEVFGDLTPVRLEGVESKSAEARSRVEEYKASITSADQLAPSAPIEGVQLNTAKANTLLADANQIAREMLLLEKAMQSKQQTQPVGIAGLTF